MPLRIAVLAAWISLPLAVAQAQATEAVVALEVPAPPAVEVDVAAEAPCQRAGECPSGAFSVTFGSHTTVFGRDVLLSRTNRFSIGFSPYVQLELTLAAGGFPGSAGREEVIDLLLGAGLRSEFADIDRVVRFYGAAGAAILSQNVVDQETDVGVTAAFHAGLGVMVGWRPGSEPRRVGFYLEARGQLRLETPYSPLEPGLELGTGFMVMAL